MEAGISGPRILYEIPVLGGLQITETMRNSWIVLAVILFLCIFLTHNLQKVPKGKQVIAEKFVLMIDNLVDTTMGPGCRVFAPYITTLFLVSLGGSLVVLVGMRPVTADLNTTAGWALMTFAMILYNQFRYHGIGGYLKELASPIFLMFPINLMGELAVPLSMSFRHFGNIVGGYVVMKLVEASLAVLSNFFLPIPLLQIGLPGLLSLYFDFFDGVMQAFIFCMLTMAYVGKARQKTENA